jgi:hypothetical protein
LFYLAFGYRPRMTNVNAARNFARRLLAVAMQHESGRVGAMRRARRATPEGVNLLVQ